MWLSSKISQHKTEELSERSLFEIKRQRNDIAKDIDFIDRHNRLINIRIDSVYFRL